MALWYPRLLDRLSPIERRTFETELSRYYSDVAREELEEGRAPSDSDFLTVRRQGFLRWLHEITLGCVCGAGGIVGWTIFYDIFGT